jgi:hypothetical protein
MSVCNSVGGRRQELLTACGVAKDAAHFTTIANMNLTFCCSTDASAGSGTVHSSSVKSNRAELVSSSTTTTTAVQQYSGVAFVGDGNGFSAVTGASTSYSQVDDGDYNSNCDDGDMEEDAADDNEWSSIGSLSISSDDDDFESRAEGDGANKTLNNSLTAQLSSDVIQAGYSYTTTPITPAIKVNATESSNMLFDHLPLHHGVDGVEDQEEDKGVEVNIDREYSPSLFAVTFSGSGEEEEEEEQHQDDYDFFERRTGSDQQGSSDDEAEEEDEDIRYRYHKNINNNNNNSKSKRVMIL